MMDGMEPAIDIYGPEPPPSPPRWPKRTIQKECEACHRLFWTFKAQEHQRTCGNGCVGSIRQQYSQGHCLNCGELIPRVKSGARRKYCNRKCLFAHWVGENHPRWTEGIEKTCSVCEKPYRRKKYQKSKTLLADICSMACWRKHVAVNGREHRAVAGTSRPMRDGHTTIKTKDNRWVAEHRLVMESILGRQLTRKEVVHHINGKKKDNRPENLLVTDQSGHRKLHHEAEKIGLMVMSGELQVIGWRDITKQGVGD